MHRSQGILLPAALAALALFIPSTLAQSPDVLYPPAEYALTLTARAAVDVEELFCAPIYVSKETGDVQLVQCQSMERDPWVSYSIIPQDLSLFSDQFREGQPLYITPRPGMGLTLGISEDGALQAGMETAPATVSLYLPEDAVTDDTPALNISFTSTGTIEPFMMMAGDKLCGLDAVVACHTTENVSVCITYENIIVCNIEPEEDSSEESAMKFSLSPLGWSWNYKRVQLLSAVNKQPCGNVFFEDKPQAIICPDHGDDITNFRADFSTNILANSILPTSSGIPFGMQTWIEYQLPSYYWRTKNNGSVVAAFAPGTEAGKSWKNWGFELVLVNSAASLGRRALRDTRSGDVRVQEVEEGTPIPVGAEVYLKSTTTKKFCKVGQKLNRIVCNSVSKDVKASPLKHTFIYNEFIPS